MARTSPARQGPKLPRANIVHAGCARWGAAFLQWRRRIIFQFLRNASGKPGRYCLCNLRLWLNVFRLSDAERGRPGAVGALYRAASPGIDPSAEGDLMEHRLALLPLGNLRLCAGDLRFALGPMAAISRSCLNRRPNLRRDRHSAWRVCLRSACAHGSAPHQAQLHLSLHDAGIDLYLRGLCHELLAAALPSDPYRIAGFGPMAKGKRSPALS